MVFAKGLSLPLSTHFSSADFDCHCKRKECEITLIDDRLPPSLEALWEIVGPFKIDSGFRCLAHNTAAGGQPNSKHTLGEAADCKSIANKPGSELAVAAERVPNFQSGGIGTYPTFVHVDVRGTPARWRSGLKASQIISC